MVPVLTSFIPPTHTHLYLPTIFKLWEAFNSSLIDDRFVELCGELAEEHIAGELGEAGPEGAAEWKTVGIWSEAEWTFLTGKALGSMSKLRATVMSSQLYLPCLPQTCLWEQQG